jgi:hypothetical protein
MKLFSRFIAFEEIVSLFFIYFYRRKSQLGIADLLCSNCDFPVHTTLLEMFADGVNVG